ncbi:hypothetical protein AVEN_4129-1 [Araneus ventricosus]|uniref:Uncharacterized protein n=1 Tax=Araneus ventricosus TaxID=182803 RepID=A0A4Y2LDX7_ARAVE|nr:hypothetical protein AVEN_4129-1 [Araneus ventricosus]
MVTLAPLGRGEIVVTLRVRNRKAPGSKPESPEDPPCLWQWCTLHLTCVKRVPVGVMRKFGEAVASSGVYLVIFRQVWWRFSNLRGLSQNSPRAAQYGKLIQLNQNGTSD